MVISQILKSEFHKNKNIENKTFFLQIKKFINYTSRATLLQKNSFVAEVTFIVISGKIVYMCLAGKLIYWLSACFTVKVVVII